MKHETGIESELGPKILDTFPWVDEKGNIGEKGAVYERVVRYAEEKDREAIKAVEKDKHKHRNERGERNYNLNEDPEMGGLDRSVGDPDNFATLVLTIDGKVVAHVSFGKDPENDNTVELATVTTMEKYKRNKFMKTLLQFVEQEAKKVFGAKKVWLSTMKENDDSTAFYPAVGYKAKKEYLNYSEKGWKGKSPYVSIIFEKDLEKPEE